MKNWHAFWHVGTPSLNIGTPYGTLARKKAEVATLLACWHVNHAGTQARMARDLANSEKITFKVGDGIEAHLLG